MQIKPKDSGAKIGDLKFRFKKFEVLSEEEDGFLVYLEAETVPLSPDDPNPPKVYLNFPFEVRGGNRRVTFLGEAAELKKMFRWLEERGVKFEVLSNSDARSSPESALDGLSGQQRKALLSAYANGYYEVPRRVNLDALAGRQNLNKSTFAEHLLKAENRLISRVIADELKHMQPEGKA